MSKDNQNKDTDEVLDFLNSLPESKGTKKGPEKSGDGKENEEFLEFLDELAAHEKSKPSTPAPTGSKFEPKRGASGAKDSAGSGTQTPVKTGQKPVTGAQETKPTEDNKDEHGADIAPIEAISSWWSNSGSNKVSELWGSITSNAQTISEQTYQLASNTTNQISQQRQKFIENSDHEQILNISAKLNSILLNMSNQITQGLMSDTDELLNILLIYDLYNMNYLDRLCSDKFNEVMSQVEGGIRVTVSNFNHKDEPNDDKINLNLFQGKVIDGEKLCFANLESAIRDYVKVTKSEDEQKKEAEDNDESTQEVNLSNVFISIQPITNRSTQNEAITRDEDAPIMIEANNPDSFAFTLILKDISNNITVITKTQPFPLKWAKWLNGEVSKEIEEIGEVNPSEWVSEWIKDGLSLGFGVLAQEYVVKRMGF